MKVKTIQIKTIEDGLRDFGKAFKLAQAGNAKRGRFEVFFASVEAIRKILTTERIKVLQHIKSDKPQSIYELAKRLGKNIKNVSQDLQFLTEAGLIEMQDSGGSRGQKRPVLLSDHIRLELVV